ncbi:PECTINESTERASE 1-RELATED [Salix viminalis]|uniref:PECTINESTERASE 1-RELATED n=1 Tax=Salix viminalis TaxID=40686 RepID=A0A9Q0YYN6_SALVM|nr:PECTINESTERASE 1-RELATED [Salix viminalis]
MNELSKLKDYPDKLMQGIDDATLQDALKVCATVLNDVVDRFNNSISSMTAGEGEKILSAAKLDDLKTWISTAAMENSTEFVSNSLAIAAKTLGLLSDFNIPIHRRLLGFERTCNSGLPHGVGLGDKRLLESSSPKLDVTVVKDDSGNCTTLSEAVGKIPKKSKSRFIIYVKDGEYLENVILDKSKWNVMIYGEGKDKTII